MDAKVALAELARIVEARRGQDIEDQRQAVKAWADSPDFPGGAGPLVFDAAGRAATAAVDVLRLLGELQGHAVERWVNVDGDGRHQDILSAAYIALEYLGSPDQTPEECNAFQDFHLAAFDYFATNGTGGNPDIFRRKNDYRAYLLDSVCSAASSDGDANAKLDIVAGAVGQGFTLFPAFRRLDGCPEPLAVMRERIAKTFDVSRLAKPLPLPSEGTAEGGEAAEIASDLLIAAGVLKKVVRNFIFVAGEMRTARKLKTAADSAGAATTPKRRRGRRPRP